MLQKYEDETMN